jgi:serine/threonine protein kinase
MRKLLAFYRDALVKFTAPDLAEGVVRNHGAVARSWWRQLTIKGVPPEEVLDRLRQLAALPAAQAVSLAQELAAEVRVPVPGQADGLVRALAQMPAHVRRTLQLAGDRQRPPTCDHDLRPFLPHRVPALLPGCRLAGVGDLTLGEFLGGGGFAEVYAVHNHNHPNSDPRALKISFHAEGRRLLRHECWMNGLVGRSRNRGILPVRHSYLDSEVPALEYPAVAGFNLRELLLSRYRAGRIPHPWWVARLMRRVALVLASLHQCRYAHRDVKPSNVMIGRYEDVPQDVVLLDLGISGPITGLSEEDWPHGDETRRCIDRILIYSNSPIYASPEQLAYRYENGYTRASDDVYSAGVIAIQALTGDLDRRVTEVRWQSILESRGTPRAFIELLQACVAANPNRRPANGRDLAERLEQVLRNAVWPPTRGRRRVGP